MKGDEKNAEAPRACDAAEFFSFLNVSKSVTMYLI
jgi:hypothetical protein